MDGVLQHAGEVIRVKLTERQQKIADMVQHEGPITGKTIAARLDVTRSALRSDLAVLTMMGLLDARPKVGYYYVGRDNVNPAAEEIKRFEVGSEIGRAHV